MGIFFWDLLAGAALLGCVLAVLTFDLGAVLVALLLLGVCCWHWRRTG